MARNQKKRKKQTRSFSPDMISNRICQAVTRDLSEAKHVYGFSDTPRIYAISRQKAELLKKYCPENLDKRLLEKNAFNKFLKVNEHMLMVNERLVKTLPDKDLRLQRSTPYMDKVHLRARAIIHWVCGSFSEDEWFANCKHSGGSTVGIPFEDTSPERKFYFPMSTTKRALPFMTRYLSFDSTMKDAVEEFNSRNPVTGWFNVVEGSQATTVNKTATELRFICKETTVGMFLQQGIMNMLTQRLQSIGLDLSSLPSQHIRRAFLSSITRREATVDWRSASDCGAIELVRWGFPHDWFTMMDAIRSPSIFVGDELVELGMISTMGNANTFPVETLIFWAYAQAVRLSENELSNTLFPEWDDLLKVSVFGDDCIVPTDIAKQYIGVMERIGFMVNDDKSFYGSEPFRESCGGDFLSGYDVRPFCLRAPHNDSLSSLEPWLYVIWNGLLTKYIQFFGETNYIYDKALFRELSAIFREYNLSLRVVPSYFTDDGGLKISEDLSRFNQCYSVKFAPIARDRHGTYSFSFCSFRYSGGYGREDGIRYAMWLKKPHMLPVGRKPSLFIKRRKIGGYVVAKSLTCHWHVPRLSEGLQLEDPGRKTR